MPDHIHWHKIKVHGLPVRIACDVCGQEIGYHALVVNDGHSAGVSICKSCAERVVQMYDEREQATNESEGE